MTDQTVDRLIDLKEVMHQVGIGKTKIYARLKRKEFPAPVKLGFATRWSQVEVQAWIEEQKAARGNGGVQ